MQGTRERHTRSKYMSVPKWQLESCLKNKKGSVTQARPPCSSFLPVCMPRFLPWPHWHFCADLQADLCGKCMRLHKNQPWRCIPQCVNINYAWHNEAHNERVHCVRCLPCAQRGTPYGTSSDPHPLPFDNAKASCNTKGQREDHKMKLARLQVACQVPDLFSSRVYRVQGVWGLLFYCYSRASYIKCLQHNSIAGAIWLRNSNIFFCSFFLFHHPHRPILCFRLLSRPFRLGGSFIMCAFYCITLLLALALVFNFVLRFSGINI